MLISTAIPIQFNPCISAILSLTFSPVSSASSSAKSLLDAAEPVGSGFFSSFQNAALAISLQLILLYSPMDYFRASVTRTRTPNIISHIYVYGQRYIFFSLPYCCQFVVGFL